MCVSLSLTLFLCVCVCVCVCVCAFHTLSELEEGAYLGHVHDLIPAVDAGGEVHRLGYLLVGVVE